MGVRASVMVEDRPVALSGGSTIGQIKDAWCWVPGGFVVYWGQALRVALAVGSGKVRPSTLQSLEKGRPTEIDIMNGYISSKGREYGVPTPVNDSLTAIIKEVEAGRRPLTKKNLRDVQEK